MMLIKRRLLAWLLGVARPTLWFLPPAMLWVLGCRTLLFDYILGILPMIFIFLHSLAIVGRLGRPSSPAGAFLYSRGYRRDALWGHQMLASLLAVLAVWLPVALLIWTPARAAVQDHFFLNPFFPLMSPREAALPWRWLAFYGLLLPALHYDWIRRAQPVRHSDSGSWLALLVVLAYLTLWNGSGQQLRSTPWFVGLLWGAGAALSLTLLLAGRRLHRELEVMP